tara:strand:- start:293 stop:766 length:474 start_codon:yes stop_codon:yes gene_type:complete
MKIKITKNKLITEGVKQTNKFLAHLKRNGFKQDRSNKDLDHSMVHILIKRSGKRDNCLVKVVLIGPDRDRFPGGGLYLSELHVQPSCRNRGHARKAMQFIMNAADTFGVRIELSAYPADDTTTKDGLHDFYTSLGFKPSGDRREMEYHRDYNKSFKK